MGMWSNPEALHINVGEATTARMAVRWMASQPAHSLDRRVIFIGDWVRSPRGAPPCLRSTVCVALCVLLCSLLALWPRGGESGRPQIPRTSHYVWTSSQ